jgi:hypothetical protein
LSTTVSFKAGKVPTNDKMPMLQSGPPYRGRLRTLDAVAAKLREWFVVNRFPPFKIPRVPESGVDVAA